MSAVGKSFPNLTVNAVQGQQKTKVNVFEEAVNNKKKVLLFWYPKDYSGLCPTELHAFQEALPDFEERNTLVIGASCDTQEVHMAWLRTPQSESGIEGITYPILSDSNRNLASMLDILDSEIAFDEEQGMELLRGENISYRATYLIDEDGNVFHESINHLPLARNVEDYLRTIDAFAHLQEFGELCPANWKKGMPVK